MNGESARALRDNVTRLIEHRGESQKTVAARGGISQRSVGNVLNYGKTHMTEPTLRTIDGLAKAFEVPSWLLLLPGLSVDLLKSRSLADLVGFYRDAPERGRDMIFRIAESEVRYAAAEPVQKIG